MGLSHSPLPHETLAARGVDLNKLTAEDAGWAMRKKKKKKKMAIDVQQFWVGNAATSTETKSKKKNPVLFCAVIVACSCLVEG